MPSNLFSMVLMTDSFDALITAAENKMKEGKGDAPVTVVITDEVPVESYSAVVGSHREVCSYCSRTGYIEKRCFNTLQAT